MSKISKTIQINSNGVFKKEKESTFLINMGERI